MIAKRKKLCKIRLNRTYTARHNSLNYKLLKISDLLGSQPLTDR